MNKKWLIPFSWEEVMVGDRIILEWDKIREAYLVMGKKLDTLIVKTYYGRIHNFNTEECLRRISLIDRRPRYKWLLWIYN